MTQTEFFNFSSLYNRASADVPFLFSPGLTEVPRKSGPACCSFRPFFTSSTSFPFNALSPCSPVPRIPPSANLPQSAPGGCRRLLNPRGPASGGGRAGHLFPSCSRAAPSRARGDPESLARSCVGLPGDAPAAPVRAARPPAPSGRGRLTSGGGGRPLSVGVARPRHPRQPGRACVRRGAASGPRPPPGPHGERELGDPARLRRQVGRAGWGSRRRDRPCAPPRPA